MLAPVTTSTKSHSVFTSPRAKRSRRARATSSRSHSRSWITWGFQAISLIAPRFFVLIIPRVGLLSQSPRQDGVILDSGETIMAVAVQNRMSDPRTRALVIPREHGAWGILLVPLVTGVAVGITSIGGAISVTLFTLVAL